MIGTLESTATVAADGSAVAEVVGVAAVEIEAHEVGDDLSAVRRSRQVSDVGPLQRLFDHFPFRGHIAVRHRFAKRFQLAKIRGSWRCRLQPNASDAIAVLHVGARPVFADPPLELLGGAVGAGAAQLRWERYGG